MTQLSRLAYLTATQPAGQLDAIVAALAAGFEEVRFS